VLVVTNDQAIVTGYSHTVCQDFSRSGVSDQGQPFVVLADGCSGSPHTDTGARLLVHSLSNWLRSLDVDVLRVEEYIHRIVKTSVRESLVTGQSLLNLPKGCCDATVLVVLTVGEQFYAYVYGDGVVALHSKERGLVVHEINYVGGPTGNSFPFYPIYMVDEPRLIAYQSLMENHGIEKVYNTHFEGSEESNIIRCSNPDMASVFHGHINETNWVAISSDGVQSFTRPVGDYGQREVIPTMEVMTRLCQFKNFNGPFVQRRLNRFLKDTERDGWRHEDDLSLGVISFA